MSASVQGESGQRTDGKLYTVSVTGGLLRLASALSRGDFVEVAFQMQAGKVQGLAEMLNPVRQPQDGFLQPFRFIALGDDDHRVLRMAVDCSEDRNAVKLDLSRSRKHL